jgi:hypothetical protein
MVVALSALEPHAEEDLRRGLDPQHRGAVGAVKFAGAFV